MIPVSPRQPCDRHVFWSAAVDELLSAERADALRAHLDDLRDRRIDALWQMTETQRVAAMRRGDLDEDQLATWASVRPWEIPRVDGIPEWLAGAPIATLFS